MTEIAILSGKGGTGKTSLSAAFATIGNNIVVADCDVDAANLHLVLQPVNDKEEVYISGYRAVINYDICASCGQCEAYCRFDAISMSNGKVFISDTSCDGCKLCSRICPVQAITMVPSDKSRWYIGNYRNGRMVHARLAPGEENSGKLVNLVREQARNVANEIDSNIIIIDGPPGTGCPVISSVTGVNKVVVVTEPSMSGFHDMKRVLEIVANFKAKPYVVINKYDLNPNISGQIEAWCIQQNIAIVGRLSFDENVVNAMVNCKSIIEYAPQSEISKEIFKIYEKVFCSLNI
ncbi:MAG TPA: ATP-binding protein [Bacteroidales bacterium]|nr:ATP-binding protein [Bacteroidales bacterium]